MNQPIQDRRVRRGGEAARQLGALPSHRVHLRLLAISKCAERPAREVAEFFAVSPATLRRWIRAYDRGGIAALADRPKGHRAPKLADAELRVIGAWLRGGVDSDGEAKRWTLQALARAVEQEFGVVISLMPLWRHLNARGYSRYLPCRHAGRAAEGRASNAA